MRTNETKAKLKAGETVFGCFVRYPDAGLVELLGFQNWDFLVFDGEHGHLQPGDCEHMVRAAELREVTPIVRVPTNEPPVILRFMDTGAQGAHIPWVNSAAAAEAAVQAIKYQPRGQRGLAGVRAAGYGQVMPLDEYIRRANEETLVVIHIETSVAVEHAAEIAAVDGVDVVYLGPTDLSHSLGVTGQRQHPKLEAALQTVAQTVLDSSAALGIYVTDAHSAGAWRSRGAQYIATGLESIVGPAARDYLRTVRSS